MADWHTKEQGSPGQYHFHYLLNNVGFIIWFMWAGIEMLRNPEVASA